MRRTRIDLEGEIIKLKRELILRALKASDGNKSYAAEVLGISRTTLIEMIKLVGLNETLRPPSRKTESA